MTKGRGRGCSRGSGGAGSRCPIAAGAVAAVKGDPEVGSDDKRSTTSANISAFFKPKRPRLCEAADAGSSTGLAAKRESSPTPATSASLPCELKVERLDEVLGSMAGVADECLDEALAVVLTEDMLEPFAEATGQAMREQTDPRVAAFNEVWHSSRAPGFFEGSWSPLTGPRDPFKRSRWPLKGSRVLVKVPWGPLKVPEVF